MSATEDEVAIRGTIGYETLEGGFIGVYCHYDSYPSHMAPILHAMFHIDVVLMVNQALARGGIRAVSGINDFELFSAATLSGGELQRLRRAAWPARREEYAYRKCLDGRLEYIDSADTPFVWGERPGEHLLGPHAD